VRAWKHQVSSSEIAFLTFPRMNLFDDIGNVVTFEGSSQMVSRTVIETVLQDTGMITRIRNAVYCTITTQFEAGSSL
jgi:hypothetical protein